MINTRNLRHGKKPFMAARHKAVSGFGKGAVPKGYASTKKQKQFNQTAQRPEDSALKK